MESVKERLQQTSLDSFKSLIKIINETKLLYTKQYAFKIKTGNNLITREYLQLMNERDQMYARWKKVPNEITKKAFTSLKTEQITCEEL